MLNNEMIVALETYKKCGQPGCTACFGAVEKAIDDGGANVHLMAALSLFMGEWRHPISIGDTIAKARTILLNGPAPILQRIKDLRESVKPRMDVITAVLRDMPNYGAKGICKHCGAKDMDFRKHGEHCKWAKALRALAETAKGFEESKEEKPAPHEETKKETETVVAIGSLVTATWQTNPINDMVAAINALPLAAEDDPDDGADPDDVLDDPPEDPPDDGPEEDPNA